MDKQAFKQKAKQSIDHLFTKIDELEAKKEQAQGDAKMAYENTIKEMKTRKKELQAKYDELSTATDEKWEEVKMAFSAATDSFQEGLGKIATLVR